MLISANFSHLLAVFSGVLLRNCFGLAHFRKLFLFSSRLPRGFVAEFFWSCSFPQTFLFFRLPFPGFCCGILLVLLISANYFFSLAVFPGFLLRNSSGLAHFRKFFLFSGRLLRGFVAEFFWSCSFPQTFPIFWPSSPGFCCGIVLVLLISANYFFSLALFPGVLLRNSSGFAHFRKLFSFSGCLFRGFVAEFFWSCSFPQTLHNIFQLYNSVCKLGIFFL